MTEDKISEVIDRVIGFNSCCGWEHEFAREIEKVARAEALEEAAKVCEEEIKSYMSKQYTTDPLGGYRERFAAEQCAAAIRGLK